MLKSKSISNINENVIEEFFEMSKAKPSSSISQSAKINIKSIDFSADSKNSKLTNNVKYKQNLHNKEKGTESEDSENSETVNLIYPYKTLRLPKLNPEAIEEQASMIANSFVRKNKIMQDNPISELLRLEMIRNMPQGLTLKRSVKAKLTLSLSKNSKRKPISYWKKLQYELNMALSKMRLTISQIGSSIELWYHPIKLIEGHFGSGIATYFKFLRWLFIINTIGCIFSILFITIPQTLVLSHHRVNFSSWDLLLGNGFFTKSIFYYGFYVNDTLMIDSNMAYDMPSAYFATFFFCYFISFFLLCFKVARSYKKCYIETSGGTYNRYANKIFCSWDWGISSYKAASLRSSSIYRELEELLWESKNISGTSSFSMKIWTYLIRVAMTSLIFTIMCGTGVLLWLLLNEHQTNESNVFSALTVPAVFTAIIVLFPPLISWSVKYERYAKDRIAFYITMVRIYILAVIAVATLFTFWLTQGIQVGCWQTRLAQEIYRLIILDLFVSLFGSFLIQAIRSSRLVRKKLNAPTFDIAHNTLNLIYNQSLFWLVHYFSPPMSLVITIKLLLTFYVKKCELLTFCEPPSKFWRAAQTQTLFLALTFLGMISGITVISYVAINVDSHSCGPFAGKNYTWELVLERIFHIRRDSTFWNTMGEIVNPGTGIALLIVMCVAVYYLRAKAEASKQMVRILREMLVWQARDKEFLLKTFSTASNKSKNWVRHRQISMSLGDLDTIDLPTSRVVIHEPSTSY